MLTKDAKNWNDPKKIEARKQTLIETYRSKFGEIIIKPGQYWSMCGQCFGTDGGLSEGCELDQVVKSGLIAPEQFHGVEINPEIFEGNKKIGNGAHWYCGDFLRTMQDSYANGNFNPSIVNADFITMPDRTAGYIGDIMSFLSIVNQPVLFVANFVLESSRFPDKNRTMEYMIDKLESDHMFQNALNSRDWNWMEEFYSYNGTGSKSKTKMASLIFYLKG